jgi:hypothetical protein
MLLDLIEAFFPLATSLGLDFLTLGLPAADSRLAVLRQRFSTRAWRSRLYRVDWPAQIEEPMNGRAAFLPDLALL